jgi:peptidyl-prolyl cis-trans isomerase D
VRNRAQPGFSNDAITRIFQIDTAKVPAYIGAASDSGGFSIFRLVKVIMPPEADPGKIAAARARIGEMQNREVFDAYVATLKSKAKIEVNQKNLEKK